MNNQSLQTLNNFRVHKRKMSRKRKLRYFKFISAVLIIIAIIFCYNLIKRDTVHNKLDYLSNTAVPDWVDIQLIDIHDMARRGEKLEDVKSIVIHYVGNAGTTAQNNRNYFNTKGVDVSSHFVVGLNGEIIQCIPLDEKSSASNHRNKDTISIEVCHPDKSGKFSDDSYNALVKLAAWLYNICELSEEDIIRHYDVTGKLCPLYYAQNQDAWDRLKEDIISAAKENET